MDQDDALRQVSPSVDALVDSVRALLPFNESVSESVSGFVSVFVSGLVGLFMSPSYDSRPNTLQIGHQRYGASANFSGPVDLDLEYDKEVVLFQAYQDAASTALGAAQKYHQVMRGFQSLNPIETFDPTICQRWYNNHRCFLAHHPPVTHPSPIRHSQRTMPHPDAPGD